MARNSQPGIYVESLIAAPLERIWQLTQDPALHQRWDLRFTSIQYLPRPDIEQPQQFLYETRLGVGLSIRGTGETSGTRNAPDGSATSALKFASEDWKSLIREGAGYWRYIPVRNGTRFLTWYDYRVRFGALGRFVDRLFFRPLIGLATAWSFDRLRLWAELDQSPESTILFALIHAAARLSLAFIWLWHGIVPKLLFRHADERAMLADSGVPDTFLPLIGTAEAVFGLAILAGSNRPLLLASGLVMLPATVAVAVKSPRYLRAAFNPVTLNVAVFALSSIAWLTARSLPSASRCLRQDPRLHR